MARKAKGQPAGPGALRGSEEAKQKASIILEALCGVRSTQQAADGLSIALARYYVLETRMLQAMIDALEPQSRGRKPDPERQLEELRADNERLQRHVHKLQALYRSAQRAVGVKPAAKAKARAAGKTTRQRRPNRKTRGERVLQELRKKGSDAGACSPTMGIAEEES